MSATAIGISSVEPGEFREALGCFATGVTVITAVGPRGELIGITANSFNSVSLDPPLILFSLNRRAYSLRAFLSTRAFAVNILRAGQEEISDRFARALEEQVVGHRLRALGQRLPDPDRRAGQLRVQDPPHLPRRRPRDLRRRGPAPAPRPGRPAAAVPRRQISRRSREALGPVIN